MVKKNIFALKMNLEEVFEFLDEVYGFSYNRCLITLWMQQVNSVSAANENIQQNYMTILKLIQCLLLQDWYMDKQINTTKRAQFLMQ